MLNRGKILALGFVVSAILSTPATAVTINLAGSEWGYPGGTGKASQFIQFRAVGKISGFAGCNRFTGTYVRIDDKLSIGPFAATRMACPPEIMEHERRFLVMLLKVRRAESTHLKLVVMDAGERVLAELVRRDPD